MVPVVCQGRIQGGGAPGTRTPPPPPKIGKNMILVRKIGIFHTKYPKILAHREVYSIKHYLIKFVNDLWQVRGFFSVYSGFLNQ